MPTLPANMDDINTKKQFSDTDTSTEILNQVFNINIGYQYLQYRSYRQFGPRVGQYYKSNITSRTRYNIIGIYWNRLVFETML